MGVFHMPIWVYVKVEKSEGFCQMTITPANHLPRAEQRQPGQPVRA
jgi:hypothetical protein